MPRARRRPAVRMDESKKAEEILRLCLDDLGFVQAGIGKPCALQWISNSEDKLRTALEADGTSRVSRLPGMFELAHKVSFARAIALAARLHPTAFDFFPQTWILPEDGLALERKLASGRHRVIVKPDGGSQGDGIFVADSWSDVRLRAPTNYQSRGALVAQDYVANPLTLHGLKFDLRVYVLVTSLSPLRVHLCREGLARFATSAYKDADPRNLTAHLTNYSLNVRDAAFEHNDDPADGAKGSKRTLTATLEELERAVEGFDTQVFWERLATLVATTCVTLQPSLLHSATLLGRAMGVSDGGGSGGGNHAGGRGSGGGGGGGNGGSSRQQKSPAARGFGLLGFDVLIDARMKLYLLEVNANPSLQIDVCELPPADFVPPPRDKRATPSAQPAAYSKPCYCMEMGTVHFHHRCLVDEVVKKAAVGGALALLLGGPRSRRAAASISGSAATSTGTCAPTEAEPRCGEEEDDEEEDNEGDAQGDAQGEEVGGSAAISSLPATCERCLSTEEGTAEDASDGAEAFGQVSGRRGFDLHACYSELEDEIGEAEAAMGSVERARRLFESVMDRKGCLTSTRARKLLHAAAGLSMAEADIAFLRAKHAAGTGEVGFGAFVEMLLALCGAPSDSATMAADQEAVAGESLETRFSAMLERLQAECPS